MISARDVLSGSDRSLAGAIERAGATPKGWTAVGRECGTGDLELGRIWHPSRQGTAAQNCALARGHHEAFSETLDPIETRVAPLEPSGRVLWPNAAMRGLLEKGWTVGIGVEGDRRIGVGQTSRQPLDRPAERLTSESEEILVGPRARRDPLPSTLTLRGSVPGGVARRFVGGPAAAAAHRGFDSREMR